MINDVAEVPVYRSGELVARAVIDGEDAERVLTKIWRLTSEGYAVSTLRGQGGATVFMHRFILGLERDDARVVDHIDRDKLNNRRSNLRAISQAANMQNRASRTPGRFSSEHRNVTWAPTKDGGRWRVRLAADGRQVDFGLFDTENEAAQTASIARALLMPYSQDVELPRPAWDAARAYMPAEREFLGHDLEERNDPVLAGRMTELVGDLSAAMLRGNSDLTDELSRLIACAMVWMEVLGER